MATACALCVQYGKSKGSTLAEQTERAMDKLFVNFGVEILKIVPGRVSTEIDARLSFDTEANVAKGRELIALYKEAGIASDRVLLKIASTWEGLQAAKQLEAEGLHVNMTLLFCVEQAALAGKNGFVLLSLSFRFFSRNPQILGMPVLSTLCCSRLTP